MNTEVWKDIPGHKGYQASSLGRIRSVPRTLRDGRQAGGVLLTQRPDKDGYLTIKLGRKRIRVHVAVQLAFAGPHEVRHLDGDRSNNKPENLAYGSKVENEKDKRKARIEKHNGRWDSPPLPLETLTETRLISLSDAVSEGYVSCTLAAVRKCSERDLGFPVPAAMEGLTRLYAAGELAVWDRRRR